MNETTQQEAIQEVPSVIAPNIVVRPVESSRIAAIGYDPSIETMAVQFVGNPGRTYHYKGVSQETYGDFSAAESCGKYFGEHINGKYAYDRVESDSTVSKSWTPAPPAEQQAA